MRLVIFPKKPLLLGFMWLDSPLVAFVVVARVPDDVFGFGTVVGVFTVDGDFVVFFFDFGVV